MPEPARTSRLILPRDRPMVVAHRGASHRIAEHTLSAYVAAIESGADAVECDVRLTADGVLVCVHDRLIDRTSNGRGAVSELELARLREMDFSSWHTQLMGGVPASDTGPDPASGGILTLDELLELTTRAERPLTTLIETRHPNRYSGEVEKKLVRTLRSHGLLGKRERHGAQVAVMSFSRMALRRVQLLAPEIPLVLLQRLGKVPRPVDGRIAPLADAAGPGWGVLRRDPQYVERVHARGGQVFAWTIDKPATIDAVLEMGVDGVITNQPAEVLEHIARRVRA